MSFLFPAWPSAYGMSASTFFICSPPSALKPIINTAYIAVKRAFIFVISFLPERYKGIQSQNSDIVSKAIYRLSISGNVYCAGKLTRTFPLFYFFLNSGQLSIGFTFFCEVRIGKGTDAIRSGCSRGRNVSRLQRILSLTPLFPYQTISKFPVTGNFITYMLFHRISEFSFLTPRVAEYLRAGNRRPEVF